MLEEKAFYYYSNKTYREAINYLDELIRLDSTNGEYYFKRGYCYSELSNDSHAFFNFEKAIEFKYSVANANMNIALIAMKNDRDSAALLYLEKALKAGSTENEKIQKLIKMCKQQVEFQKTDTWKAYQEYKARTKQNE
jgi:Flp pilus assembly protein TadD